MPERPVVGFRVRGGKLPSLAWYASSAKRFQPSRTSSSGSWPQPSQGTAWGARRRVPGARLNALPQRGHGAWKRPTHQRSVQRRRPRTTAPNRPAAAQGACGGASATSGVTSNNAPAATTVRRNRQARLRGITSNRTGTGS